MRYTGPKMKLCRREGRNLFGSEKYVLAKSNRGPMGRGFGRMSLFGQQLRTKQAVKRSYGLSEKQFQNYYKKANKASGNTIMNMQQLLDTRLDVVVLRSNFARTIMQARQFVNHGHFLVNGTKVNIPSYQVRVGDVIEVRENKKSSTLYTSIQTEFDEFISQNNAGSLSSVSWLKVEPKGLKITIDRLPEGDDFENTGDMARIIEFYSK